MMMLSKVKGNSLRSKFVRITVLYISQTMECYNSMHLLSRMTTEFSLGNLDAS